MEFFYKMVYMLEFVEIRTYFIFCLQFQISAPLPLFWINFKLSMATDTVASVPVRTSPDKYIMAC